MVGSVRRAATGDAATIARLYAAVQDPHARAHPEIFLPSAPAAAEAEYARWLASPDWYGLLAHDADARAVGYALAHPISYAPSTFTGARAYLRLDQMAVLPEAEGRGHGTALVRAVFALARELRLGRVELNVWAFNERARRLYEREGFVVFRHEMGADLPG